jgi:hypothetical protein
MAQTIQIKRTTGTGKPTNVAAGELFYAYDTSTSGGTYAKRLAIGHSDGGTNAPEIIGGKVFMDMLDHTAGNLTASSAIITDSGSYIDDLKIKNQGGVKLYELTAQGSSYTTVRSAAALAGNITYTLPAAPTNGYVLQTNGSGDLSWVAAGGTLTVGADSGTDDAVDLVSDSLTFAGTANEIETTVSDNTITIGLPTNVTISGDLTVSGNTTTVNTSTLAVEDPLLALATGNNGSDAVDIGFYGLYDDSGSQDEYTGLFRDAGDQKWKLFKNLQAAPTTTVNVAGTGYAVATLVADIETANATITGGSVTGITDLVVADGGTGRGTFTTNGVLYGNGTTGLLATAAGTTGQIMYSNAGVPAWTDGVDGGTYS